MHALHHLLRSAMVAGIVIALSGSLLQAQPYSHEVRSATIDDPSLTAPVGMIWIQAVGFGKNDPGSCLRNALLPNKSVEAAGKGGHDIPVP